MSVIVPREIKKIIKDWTKVKAEIENQRQERAKITKVIDERLAKLKADSDNLGREIMEYMGQAEIEEIKFKGGGGVKIYNTKRKKITPEIIKNCLEGENLEGDMKNIILKKIEESASIETRNVRKMSERKPKI